MAQIFEGGLVFAPAGQWDQTQAVAVPPTRSIVEPPNIPWTHEITGFHGNRWEYWERFLQNKIPGLTWHIFMEEMVHHNPDLEVDGFVFKPHKVYKMPLVVDQVEARPQPPVIVATPPPAEATEAEAPPAIIAAPPSPDFVQIAGDKFCLKGKPSRFIGANIRGLVHYGHDPDNLPHTYVDHQPKQLQEAAMMNIRLARVFLAHKNASPSKLRPACGRCWP